MHAASASRAGGAVGGLALRRAAEPVRGLEADGRLGREEAQARPHLVVQQLPDLGVPQPAEALAQRAGHQHRCGEALRGLGGPQEPPLLGDYFSDGQALSPREVYGRLGGIVRKRRRPGQRVLRTLRSKASRYSRLLRILRAEASEQTLKKEYVRDGNRRIIGSVTEGFDDTTAVVRDENNQIAGRTSERFHTTRDKDGGLVSTNSPDPGLLFGRKK